TRFQCESQGSSSRARQVGRAESSNEPLRSAINENSTPNVLVLCYLLLQQRSHRSPRGSAVAVIIGVGDIAIWSYQCYAMASCRTNLNYIVQRAVQLLRTLFGGRAFVIADHDQKAAANAFAATQ